jgi:uncharacterized protein
MPSELLNNGQRKDRVLGDEWKNWDGSLMDQAQAKEGSKGIFVAGLLSLVILTLAASYFILYMITPRLKSISAFLYLSVFASVVAGTVLLLIWFISIFSTAVFEKGFIIGRSFNIKIMKAIIDNITKLGSKCGISKDRMANSFLKVFNIITVKSQKRMEPVKPLIILPRCLDRESREKAADLAKGYGLEFFIVGGGEAAKAKIKEINPSAIIGVACERDLINGIKEVSSDIPVFAIPNKRPQGPCKETSIDPLELEKAIRNFLKI